MQNHTKSLLYAGLVVLCWSTVATAFKIALSELSTTGLLFIAAVTACVIFFAEVIFTNKFNILLECIQDKKSFSKCLLLGFINPLLYYLVLFKAYDLLPAQVAQPINCSWQILLPLLAIPFLKRKMSLFQLIGLTISFVGIIFISLQGDISAFRISSPFGVLLAVASAFIWAFYWILKIDSKTDPVVELFINFFTGSIILLIYFCVTGFSFPSIKGLFAGIYVGAFEMGIAFICWAKALKLSSNTARLSQLTYLAPFFSLILIHFILGETIYWTTIAGLCLIISGILVGNALKSRVKIR